MSMSPLVVKILEQLNQIENIMHAIGLHTHHAPPPTAFNSAMPFCCDEMSFHQWLQWVLIPGTRYLLVENRELPYQNHIYTMAETELASLPQETDELLLAIRTLDDLLRQLQ